MRFNPVNKDDGYKAAHIEGPHVLTDESGIAAILCVTPGRTFTYYHANICQDINRKNNYPRRRTQRYHRERQSKDTGQGRNSTGPATINFRRKTVRRR